MLEEIKTLNTEIVTKEAELKASGGVQVINLYANTELFMRVICLLLNLIFAHAFARAVERNWPNILMQINSFFIGGNKAAHS